MERRYELEKLIGCGTYGKVWIAKDLSREGTKVAVKYQAVMKAVEEDKQVFLAKRAYREVKILQHLQGHENILTLFDVFSFESTLDSFQSICIVTDLLQTDLAKTIRSRGVPRESVKGIVYQILRGLKFIHSAGVLHRDLKPANIGISGLHGPESLKVKILDFGLARESGVSNKSLYVVTRYYRPPEMIFNQGHYSEEVDIWSVGCIFAELISGQVLFKADTYLDQVRRIIKRIGTPADLLTFSDDFKDFIQRQGYFQAPEDFLVLIPQATDEEVAVLEKMIKWTDRISVVNALAEPFFSDFHDPLHPEPVCAKQILLDSGVDKHTVGEWKELLFREVRRFEKADQMRNDIYMTDF